MAAMPIGRRVAMVALVILAFSVSQAGASTPPFYGGDANGDGALTFADVTRLIDALYQGGPAPAGTADANFDGQVTSADLFWLIGFLYSPTATDAGVLAAVPTALTFPATPVGSSTSLSLVLANRGGALAPSISISAIDVTGAAAGDFTTDFSAGTSGTLAPGQATVVTVTITPQSSGERSATLEVTNDGVTSPLAVGLLGTGGQAGGTVLYRINVGGPEIAGTPAWSADTLASPSPYVTGGGDVYSTTAAIDTSNPSVPAGTPMELFQTQRWDRSDAPEMAWALPVPPGSYEVRLYFAETYPGAQTVGARLFDVAIEGATVLSSYDVFADAGADAGVVKSFVVTSDATLDIAFTHVVQNPMIEGIEVISLSGAGVLGAAPTSLSFGTVTEGSSGTQPVVLTNLGSSGDPDITIDTAGFSGADAASFSSDASVPIVLTPGQSATVNVSFSPTASGSASASFDLTHTGGNTPLSISLSGTGEAPVVPNLGLSPTSLGFGTVAVGSSRSLALELSNTAAPGGPDIVVSSVAVTGANAADFADDFNGATGLTIPAGGVATLSVTFTPSAVGGSSASLDISHSGNNSPVSVPLSGTGGTGVGSPIYRVNAGGPSVADTLVWAADTGPAPSPYVNGGGTYETAVAVSTSDPSIPAGTPAEIFQTERYDDPAAPEMQWAFPVTPGSYEVRLFFAEIYDQTQAVGARVFDVAIEGAPVLTNYDIFADVGGYTGVMKSFRVVSDSSLDILFTHVTENPVVQAIEIIPLSSATAQASVGVLLNSAINSSTYATGAFQITDTSTAGQSITSVRFDLTTSLLPSLVFDPDGTAGDTVAKDFTPDSGAATVGLTGHVFSSPDGGGYDVLDVTFGDFQPGEGFTFSVDVDPTSIKGATQPGPNESGSVSGLELTGATVTVTYDDGSVQVARLFRQPGSDGGSELVARDPLPLAPGLAVVGQATLPATVADPNQVVRLTAPATSSVRLLVAEAGLYLAGVPGGGYDIQPYEANDVVLVSEYDVTMPSSGTVDVPVVLTRQDGDSGYNVLTAVVSNPDGTTGANSSPVVLKLEPAAVPTLAASPPSLDFGSITAGTSASLDIILTNVGDTGTGDLTVTSSTIGGTDGTLFSDTFNDTTGVTLSPGQSTTVTVTFAPTDVGSKSATLSLANTGAVSPLDVALSGTAAVSGVGTVAFTKSVLAGTGALAMPTSLQFGPDGRLYVAEQDGLIRAYTVARTGPGAYAVTATETISAIQSIPNHDDDGSPNASQMTRQVTGLLVGGTPSSPVLYVSSSDPRIGGGGTGTNLGNDTNSGVITRLTWNGSSWDFLNLVEGLPRSRENHSTNGLAFDPTGTLLLVAQGGNTNLGAPSNNFALLPEYALSAAVLAVDLAAIGNTTYVLPTLDDEDRPGNPDANDPWGGNGGKNQAILLPGGPVQVYGSGFRNPYDVVVTDSGRVYAIDNGSNAGWGDIPVDPGPSGVCTNGVNEPGLTEEDGLHLVTAGSYSGHANPTRGNTANTFNASNPQTPVPTADPVECDPQDTPVNGSITTFTSSTNGIAEYTASSFGGAMTGDLLAASFDNAIYRIKLDASGTALVLKQALFSNVGLLPLDVVAEGDADVFPGTIWAVDHSANSVIAFEPSDFAGCTGVYDRTIDEDGDHYTNADEIDNGTNPCSAADFPPDWDGDYISNLNDPDDDNDGIPDTSDPFAIDPDNGTTTAMPISYTWDNNQTSPGKLLGLGFTGLMTNGSSNYASLYDPAKMTAGGAAGVLTVDEVPSGDALDALNTQQYAFQLGFAASLSSPTFDVHTRIVAPFAGITPVDFQSMGLFLGTGDQDNYLKIVVEAAGGGGGVGVVSEVGGVSSTVGSAVLTLPGPDAVELYLRVDPAAGTAQASFAPVTAGVAGTRTDVGPAFTLPVGWLTPGGALAAGIISTSRGATPFAATWDLFEVTPVGAAAAAPQASLTMPSAATGTQDSGAFRLANDSSGGQRISSVEVDLSTAALGDLEFDPSGKVADGVGKDFTVDSGGGAVGLRGHRFAGRMGNGYRSLRLDFDHFDPGDVMTFSVDVDPASAAKASLGTRRLAANVTGTGLIGARVRVFFSDGTAYESQLFPSPAAEGDVQAVVRPGLPGRPEVQVVGLAASPSILRKPGQVVRVSGPVGAQAVVAVVEGPALQVTPGTVAPPFASGGTLGHSDYSGVVGADGVALVPVQLLPAGTGGGLNYLLASVTSSDGTTGRVSAPVLLELR